MKKAAAGLVAVSNGYSSKDRLRDFSSLLPEMASDQIDPSEIDWVYPNLGITASDGVYKALNQGAYVINVAGEISNKAHIKIPVSPYSGSVKRSLDKISNQISAVMDKDPDRKVVVHCAMGMERSVLAVVWHLHRTDGLTVDECYRMVKKARCIALDRREWIYS